MGPEVWAGGWGPGGEEEEGGEACLAMKEGSLDEGERLSSLQAFASTSSLHGLSHIFAYGSRSFRRALWTLFFLGSVGLLTLVCVDRITYFFSYAHVTKLDEVSVANLTFPAVTICNLNEFRFSKITRNDLYHVGNLLALLNSRYEISSAHLADPETLAALREKANFKGFQARPFDMAEFYNRTGHDIAEMVLQCTFRGANCSACNFTRVSVLVGIWAGGGEELLVRMNPWPSGEVGDGNGGGTRGGGGPWPSPQHPMGKLPLIGGDPRRACRKALLKARLDGHHKELGCVCVCVFISLAAEDQRWAI